MVEQITPDPDIGLLLSTPWPKNPLGVAISEWHGPPPGTRAWDGSVTEGQVKSVCRASGGERKRPGDGDALPFGHVPEVFIEAQHRGVAGLGPGVERLSSVSWRAEASGRR